MKGLLFLSLVGAAIYALLVYTNDALNDRTAEISSAGSAQSDHTVGNHFSSWDTYLPTPATENSQSGILARRDGEHNDKERWLGYGHRLLPQGYTRQWRSSDGARSEWAKVMPWGGGGGAH